MKNYSLSHLRELESESIFIFREVVPQFQNPVLLFSWWKDSILMAYLAKKVFWPAKIPFPLMHIDTGHNFDETIEFRDWFVKEYLWAELIVAKVQDSIDAGKVVEEKWIWSSRNKLQTVTLLDAIEDNKFDCAMWGGRRDEEKARAKERFFSHRDEFWQWDPKNQRPELWNIFNGLKNMWEHFRVFPLSNWTELDVRQYIKEEEVPIPDLYKAHVRECVVRDWVILAAWEYVEIADHEIVEKKLIRFRTICDMTCTGAVESEAVDLEMIIEEISIARTTERWTRADDKRSEAAMEDRKKEGYF